MIVDKYCSSCMKKYRGYSDTELSICSICYAGGRMYDRKTYYKNYYENKVKPNEKKMHERRIRALLSHHSKKTSDYAQGKINEVK